MARSSPREPQETPERHDTRERRQRHQRKRDGRERNVEEHGGIAEPRKVFTPAVEKVGRAEEEHGDKKLGRNVERGGKPARQAVELGTVPTRRSA